MVTVPPILLEPFLAAADEAAQQRDDVDLDVAREVMVEAATMLHNSLALDDLDDHDLAVVVAGLSTALVAPDPVEAVRALAPAVADEDVHDPSGVRAAYVTAVSVLQL